MNWNTGNWTSCPDDQRAFLERDADGWWAYPTDKDGQLLLVRMDPVEFPMPLHSEPFVTVEEAQQWVESYVPERSTTNSL